MWEALGPSLISAGGNFLGGLANIYQGNKAMRQEEHLAQRNIDYQKEYAQNALQWRINDGKAAGLHPLFSMGAQLPSFTPVAVSDRGSAQSAQGWSDIGRSIGDGAAAYAKWKQDRKFDQIEQGVRDGKDYTKVHTLQDQIMQTEADLREESVTAARLDNDIRRLELENRYQNKAGQIDNPEPEMSDAVNYKPDQVIRGSNGQTAGTHPAWKKWQLDKDLYIDLPWSDEGVAESLEGAPIWLQALIIKRNTAKYGEAWRKRALEALGLDWMK